MRILVSHTNYPAQFRRLAPALVEQGHDVVFVARSREWHAPDLVTGLRLLTYEPHRQGSGAALHPYLRRFEDCVLQGQAVFRVCQQLREQGWIPDWILNHVGFGNGLYLSDAFPEARRVGLFEWYYRSVGADVDFLRQGAVEPDRALRLRTWNAQTLLELADCDIGVVPTQWQRQQFPAHLASRLRVIHEGIDTQTLAALPRGTAQRPDCLPTDPAIEVLTYVSRGFEEYRGFPQAMQAIALLQQRRPNLHVLIAGADVVAYGAGRADGRSWGAWARQDLALEPARTHWLGPLQQDAYHRVLACSDVHLYLTVPFVLSWSLLEAMAAGCCIVASATPPVQEVLQHGTSAELVDFFSPQDQAAVIEALLEAPERRQSLAAAARRAAQAYDAIPGLQAWTDLLCGNSHQTAQELGQIAVNKL
jgi:glycosyltransferase involved in cell wall biosynthesis